MPHKTRLPHDGDGNTHKRSTSETNKHWFTRGFFRFHNAGMFLDDKDGLETDETAENDKQSHPNIFRNISLLHK
jgi:hypothetical protein